MIKIEDIYSIMWSNQKDFIDFVYTYIKGNLRTKFSFADIGSGTGLLFTLPIFHKISNIGLFERLVGYDVDAQSIEWANAASRELFGNDPRIGFKALHYESGGDVFDLRLKFLGENYDIVSCNSVLEHTRNPLELLIFLADILKTNGIIFISIPNGYGPYEIDSFIYRKFYKHIFCIMRDIKHIFSPPPIIHCSEQPNTQDLKETFNADNNHHVQFFSEKCFMNLIKKAKLRVVEKRQHGFMNGPLYNQYCKNIKFINNINIFFEKRIPFCFANTWWFVLKKL